MKTQEEFDNNLSERLFDIQKSIAELNQKFNNDIKNLIECQRCIIEVYQSNVRNIEHNI